MLMLLAAAALCAPGIAQAQTIEAERVDLTLDVTGVSAKGRLIDGSEDADKSGGIFGAQLGWDRDSGADHFDVDVYTRYYAYSDSERSNRWYNRVVVAYGRDLDEDVRLTVRTDLTSSATTLESRDTDEARVRGVLSYSPGPHRVRMTAGWRWRDYQDVSTGTGDGFISELEYRYRLGRRKYVLVEVQYDQIDSDITRRSYDRITVHGELDIEIAPHMAVEIGARWKDWSYPGRTAGDEKKQDYSISPELNVQYEFQPDWFVEAGGLIIKRRSNDTRFNETVERVQLGVSKRFRLIR